MIRKCICILIGISFILTGYAAKQPDWVKQRPADKMYYIGIGRTLKSTPNYMQEAKQQALSDLVSEIKIEVSVNSLMNSIENDDKGTTTSFEETIRSSAQEDIKEFELVDTWQNDKEYWVYYRLNRTDYEAYNRQRKEAILKKAGDYWYKGHQATEAGDLITAIDFYMNGIKTIQPCLNEDLLYEFEGETLHLGTELYTALKNIFNGIVITPSESIISGTPFQKIKEPITLAVTKDGTPLRNLKLISKFISGSGDLSLNSVADENGMMQLYIKNITSKNTRQEIQISMDDKPFNLFQGELFDILKRQLRNNIPSCNITVEVADRPTNACLMMKQSGNDGLARGLRTLLTNNYFTLVADEDTADFMVLVDVKFEPGGIVPGDIYNIREYFTTIEVTLLDNRIQSVVLTYLLDKKRTGASEKVSKSNALSAATREVLKQVNRELGRQLKDLKINTTN